MTDLLGEPKELRVMRHVDGSKLSGHRGTSAWHYLTPCAEERRTGFQDQGKRGLIDKNGGHTAVAHFVR